MTSKTKQPIKPWRSTCQLQALASAAFLLVAAAPFTSQAQQTGLNVVTMNVAMVPGVPVIHGESNYAGCPISWLGTADYDCLARKISEQILAADYDVVILNEVFADSPKSVFNKELSARFPHRVTYLRDEGSTGGPYVFAPDQDSGLMLFSRFPVIASANQQGHLCDISHFSLNGHGIPVGVNFRGFGDMSLYEDRWATKGVGYVRLEHPTSRKYNVFFTHLQASYAEHAYCAGQQCEAHKLLDWDTRAGQLALINDYINCHANQGGQHGEEVFILAGDLNINGDVSNPWSSGYLGENARHNRFEWDKHFNSASPNRVTLGGTGTTAGRDLWAFAMQPTVCIPTLFGDPEVECRATPFPPGFLGPASFDRGFTFQGTTGKELEQERYDYFVMGSPENPTPQSGAPDTEFCGQHVSAAWNLFAPDPENPTFGFEGGLTGAMGRPSQTSDHFGLNVELEKSWKHCNPTNALVDPQTGISLELQWDKSIQWIQISEPGTYTFNVNPKNHVPPGADNGLDFRVFQPTDMSRPLAPPNGEAQNVPHDPILDLPEYTDIKYNVPVAPFFVKVFKKTPSSAPVPYEFLWQRNTCTTMAEACDRFPFESLEGDDPMEHFPFTAGYEKWYAIHTSRSDGGVLQTVSFYVTEPRVGSSAPNIEKLEVIDASTLSVVYTQTTPDPVQFGSNEFVTWRIGPVTDGQVDAREKKFFLKVTRRLTSTDDFDYWLGWETNLNYALAHPSSNLHCREQQEWPGNDEIWAEIKADGCKFPNPNPNPATCDNYAGIQDGVEIGDFGTGGDDAFMSTVVARAGVNVFGDAFSEMKTIKYVDQLEVTLGEDDFDYDETYALHWGDVGPRLTAFPVSQTWYPGSGNYAGTFYIAHYLTMGKSCTTNAQCQTPSVCAPSGFCGH